MKKRRQIVSLIIGVLISSLFQKIWQKSRTTFDVILGLEVLTIIHSLYGFSVVVPMLIILTFLLYTRAISQQHNRRRNDI